METMRRIINEFRGRQLPDVKPRRYDRQELESRRVNEIVGVRRCGKTYLMYQMIRELAEPGAAVYVNFEDRRLYPLTPASLDDVLAVVHEEGLHKKHRRVYLFLDEIQNVPEWERFVRNVYDDPVQRIKVVVSGSNARLLSEDYGRLLTGRHLPISLYPLSFAEYLSFRDIVFDHRAGIPDETVAVVRRALDEYLEFGGFPEVALGARPWDLLRQYYADIVLRDVAARERPRKSAAVIEAIGKYLLTNIAAPTSLHRLQQAAQRPGAGISTPTVGRYVDALERAFLVVGVPKHSFKLGGQVRQPRKYYCIDTGMRNAVSFRFSADMGRLCESAVALELRRRGRVIYYWKDDEQREVDFVVREGLAAVQLIQVCLDLKDRGVRQRELIAIARASRELNCRDCIVITADDEGPDTFTFRDLRVRVDLIPLWKWLLGVEPGA